MRLLPPGDSREVVDCGFETGMRVKALKDLLDLPDDCVVTVNSHQNLAIMKEDGVTYLGYIDLENEQRILFEEPQ